MFLTIKILDFNYSLVSLKSQVDKLYSDKLLIVSADLS